MWFCFCVFFFQAEDGIRDLTVTGVQTCALPILSRGPESRAIGAPVSNVQVPCPGARRASNPFAGSPAVRSPLAQARCREPAPWQASQETSISVQLVAKRSFSASYFFRTPVEWHSAHMWFQFCAGPVQCRTSWKSILSLG